ncbi:putative 4-deoxy-4-formamido-L-arabinose-phosphoundecaprenol deformylase ArnD [Vibrio mediterranei]|uniref:Probable 4-deoxy-4-formamido-L-arabinose-phosphoundecaprenol deformylase ArnD n=1 Tax=Vibrio mediterranei TaxID=689 RepID=A0ABX5DH41_9VIBR|nr:4-deoxy-4-formamido-L-arabinose-phosphoundecaprenol deformylase [Vibrio mediterranei]MCG9662087.1 4-deoxy-4-formamido-L-arabinose-phosphoundecaprenol deformylase [Vibrio mediterranei]PCD88624.1 4-deoxy-4-formamido-L-arabinose-phosphoundecaprenol deformylase [Vibrio mediterranei]PRQ67916.1 4-deoxy-4-formamido-L-arabinose-phosphoundecaprenol deformylase [Vibrio mediterranei]PTC03726.1 4-deoxy-4-formamido-L-arabinose-phosphoundecaprenol deformylase [Vibrio mediterranei]SBO09436.1 putative 4-de
MEQNEVTQVGLRIDVDTFRGTKLGVPKLLEIFEKHGVKASFFFTVGPDNMGRHIWRLLRPAFLKKMLRSKAASLYGYDILIRGTIWPGPVIGKKLRPIIEAADKAGHEIGLHAWDHHKWQMKTDTMSPEELRSEISKGYNMLKDITGRDLPCSAVAGWRCTDQTLVEKDAFPFKYNSDCRGDSIFSPGEGMAPQIPVTLPTYDELVGQDGVDNSNYNDAILKLIKRDGLNVYTIHAEVEGIVCAEMFEDLIVRAKQQNIEFVPMIDLLEGTESPLPRDAIKNIEMEGREGWLTHQASFVERMGL